MTKWKCYTQYGVALILLFTGCITCLVVSDKPGYGAGPFWGLVGAVVTTLIALQIVVRSARRASYSPKPVGVILLVSALILYLAAYGAGFVQNRQQTARVMFLVGVLLTVAAWFVFRVSRALTSGANSRSLQDRSWLSGIPEELQGPTSKLVVLVALVLMSELLVSLPLVPSEYKFKFFVVVLLIGSVVVGFIRESTLVDILKAWKK